MRPHSAVDDQFPGIHNHESVFLPLLGVFSASPTSFLVSISSSAQDLKVFLSFDSPDDFL